MNCFVVVPVYNEGQVFERWLPSLLKVAGQIQARVVVVDDGSDVGLEVGAVEDTRVVVLRHDMNCGTGAAVMTGISYARQQGAEVVLTIDGDGQHRPSDLLRMLQAFEEISVDVVNGSRFLKRQKIPFFRRIANRLANVITFLLSGFWLSDSQSGMKGFSGRALEQLDIRSAGYEWCSEVFREANWYDLRVQEVPISVHYTRHSLSKGQGFAVGVDTVLRLIVKSLVRQH